MADPVNDVILATIKTRLEAITIANGYAFNVGTVAKPDRDSDQWIPRQNSIYIETEEETENESLMCPGNPPRIGFDLPVLIHGYCKQLDFDTAEVAAYDLGPISENRMAAEIQKAITNNDAGSWHTFGGYAKYARFATKMQFDEPGWDGATVRLVVSYRVSELDATAVG